MLTYLQSIMYFSFSMHARTHTHIYIVTQCVFRHGLYCAEIHTHTVAARLKHAGINIKVIK